jgi:hypothetical protein
VVHDYGPLQRLPLRRLALQEEGLGEFTLATDLERPEILVPGTIWCVRFGFAPELELVEVLGGYLAIRDAIKEVLT